MADVTVVINKRNYTVSCDDGQERHVLQLAAAVDKKVHELVAAMGQIGDQRLLVMAGILLADQIEDMRREAQDREKAMRARVTDEIAAELAQSMEAAAQRIEALANEIERA
jgi:cell division protein ZapA